MNNQIEEADFVLVVCTENYEKRFKGKGENGKGLGSNLEGAIITQELYDEGGKNDKFIPIIFSSEDSNFRPTILKSATFYRADVEESYEELYTRLTNQIWVSKPELGKLKQVTPISDKQEVKIGQIESLTSPENSKKPDIGKLRDMQFHEEQVSPETKSNVPYPRNFYFTGRDDKLEQVHEYLFLNNAVAISQPIAVCGLGGIGKTQAAIEYTYRYRNEYEFVFWVTADSEDSIISDYVVVAKLLDLPVKNDSDQNLVVSAVKNWLKTNESWLLVFDNADDLDLVKNFLPLNPKGHILLTSRAQFFDNLGISSPIKMEKMLPEEARNFFIKRTEHTNLEPSELKALEELTLELDYLPLAIEQAGAYIKKIKCSFEDYLSSYKKRGLKLLEQLKVVSGNYSKSVATTWLLNFERVEQDSKVSAEILFASAFLNSSQIPAEIFIKGAKELGSVISSALEDVESDPLVLDEIFEPLTQYSLITRDIANHTYDIHRLVQAVLKDRMDENTQRLWIERVVKAVNCAFPGVEYENWELCDKLLPHAQECAGYIMQWGLETEEAAKLLNSTGNYLFARVRFEEGELFCNRSLNIRKKILDPNHPDLAESLNNLAGLYKSLGRYSHAEPLYNRALEIREKILDPDHPDLAESLNDLAGLYKSLGRYSHAEPLYNRALEISEKVLGSEHPDVAAYYNNLAGLYESLGRFFDAEPLYNRALEISEEVLGSEHPDVANSLNNLAVLYVHQGRYSDAEPLFKRALAIREEVLGSEHPSVASSLNNLAGLYNSLGRYSDAEPLFKRALAINETVLGSEHPMVGSSLNNLAGLYDSLGRYSDAEPLYNRALEIREKVLGSEHPDVANSLNNLAEIYKLQGKYSDAKPLYTRALDISEEVLGSEHPDVATYLNNLAEIYKLQGRYSDAESLYTRALKIREKVLGSEHPDVANSLHNLATFYASQGRYSDAEPLFKRALAISEKVLGSEHPSVASSLNNLAGLYDSQGRYSDAEPLYILSLKIREKVLGSEHPKVATSLNNLAVLYMSQRKNLKAKELFIRSINITKKSKGENDPDFLKFSENYACLLNKMRKGREASKILKHVEYIRAKNKKKS